ncbi:hypothetical protein EV189_1076 [Motilibacter rhizosphaerae]|uniref:Uncharacterized protein n=1 Tax=Motilibacter rhizosphaerae TaxID=598652 RepID=A0A4Q7NX79_9ACTN|nr:hypothetical protein [Motilibacter rhizosphaerae]RZS91824.1 hypothetical protein EV189_1076 [Motilibacter rhizosphaerae]
MLAVAVLMTVVAAFAVLILLGNRRRSAPGEHTVSAASTADAEEVKAAARAWGDVARARNSGASP